MGFLVIILFRVLPCMLRTHIWGLFPCTLKLACTFWRCSWLSALDKIAPSPLVVRVAASRLSVGVALPLHDHLVDLARLANVRHGIVRSRFLRVPQHLRGGLGVEVGRVFELRRAQPSMHVTIRRMQNADKRPSTNETKTAGHASEVTLSSRALAPSTNKLGPTR